MLGTAGGHPLRCLVVRRPTLIPAQVAPEALKSENGVFQFHADVRSGQSGSPLLDEYGAVVGVVTKMVDSVTTYEKTGRLVTNIGFAIPISIVLAFLDANRIP